MPSAPALLMSVVACLVDDEAMPARLLDLAPTAAILRMADGSVAALFTPQFGPPKLIRERLHALVEEAPGEHIKLAIIGGDADVRELMPPGGGMLSRRAVQLFHLGPGDDGWTLWTGGGGRASSPLGQVLQRAGRGELPAGDRAVLAGRVEKPQPISEEDRARYEQGRAFMKGLQVRPRATWAVLGVLLAIFGCELWWGGSESLPTLVRMGGNTDATLEGEPWRLLSSALLHAGFIHIAVNGYVLVILGGFMEKLLGVARYGVLLGGAALGGGLASALLSPALVSVGASGAIWGVLGAAAALAWRPGDVIPPMLVAPLRRNAMINLGLGLGVSFLPQVDLWAHLGGGAAGAALVLAGVVTQGVESGAKPDPTGPVPARERRWAIGAGAVAAAMLASLAVAWGVAKPWQLAAAPTWAKQTLAPGVEPQLPKLLGEAQPVEADQGEQAWSIGDEMQDPLVLTVVLAPVDADTRAANLARYEAEGLEIPESTEVRRPWHARQGAAHPTFAVEYAYPNGLIGGFWVQVREQTELQVYALRWPASSDQWGQALDRVLRSLEAETTTGAQDQPARP